jgi:arabinofuranan 3-O-arabinosyltransferase
MTTADLAFPRGLPRDKWLPLALLVAVAAIFCYRVYRYTAAPAIDLLPVYTLGWAIVRRLDASTIPSLTAYAYPPGAAIPAAVLGLLQYSAARTLMLVLNAAAIVAGAHLLMRRFGWSWLSWAGVAVLAGLTASEPVSQTLYSGNINGLIFLAEVMVLLAADRGRWTPAGLALGLSIAIKPVLAPLLLIFIARRRWLAIVVALSIAATLVAVGWLVTINPVATYGEVLRTLGTDGGSESVALKGAVEALELPPVVSASLRGAAVLAGVLLLWRSRASLHDAIDPWEWSGILLAATFLASAFSWTYYGIFLVPVVFRVLIGGSRAAIGVLAIAVYFVAAPDVRFWLGFGHAGFVLMHVRVTFGFALFLAAIGIAIAARRGRSMAAASESAS